MARIEGSGWIGGGTTTAAAASGPAGSATPEPSGSRTEGSSRARGRVSVLRRTRRAAALVVVALLAVSLFGCSSDSGSDEDDTVKVKPVPAKLEADVRAAARERADDIRSMELRDGALVVETVYPREAESGPKGLAMCVTAQGAGWDGGVQVLASDQGVIASTRQKKCAARV